MSIDAPEIGFRRDGTFRVLQLADVQDGPFVSSDALALIDAAVREADPDLVILTGDQIRGYDPAYMATFVRRHGEEFGRNVPLGVRVEDILTRACETSPHDAERAGDVASRLDASRRKVQDTFRQFLAPIVSRGIPFAATYGNHDFQCGVSVEEQDDMYREFEGCLNPSVASSGSNPLCCEPGTFAIPVGSADGSHTAMSIMLVNSGDFEPGGGYGSPSDKAVSWLGEVQSELRGTGPAVPSIVFQHIPTHEFYKCLRRVSPFTPHAVEGYRMFSDSCYVINPEVCRPGSILGEGPCCSERNVGEVEMMSRTEGYFALYCGHDHKNSFIGHVDGLDLGYAPTCGFCSYGPRATDRALRLVVFHEDDPASYETRLLSYGDLVGRRVSNPLRILAGEYMISGMPSLRNLLRHPGVALSFAGLALQALAVGLTHRRRRRDGGWASSSPPVA